jgi:predicted alpha-1,6-mannanase (GH76 family)
LYDSARRCGNRSGTGESQHDTPNSGARPRPDGEGATPRELRAAQELRSLAGVKTTPLFLALALGAAACGSSSSPHGTATAAPTMAPSAIAVSAASLPALDPARALDAWRSIYWDSAAHDVFKNSDHKTHGGNLYSDFWWQAHFVETALDAYEATHDPNDEKLVAQLFDGFAARHASWTNDFNDDLCWWALALAHAFERTGETRYRHRAVTIYESVNAFEDQTYGGGVWWKRNGTQPGKNVCINCPFVMLALHLHAWTGDARYLDRAKRIYDWVRSRLTSGGSAGDTIEGTGNGGPNHLELTYNYGTFIGASLALADATGDPSYLANADAAADTAMTALTVKGILKDEGDDDGGGFKMILTRYLARLAQRSRPAIASFIATNAATAWSHRRHDDLMGHDWSSPAPAGSIQSFTAASAVDLQFHAVLATLAPLPAPRRTTIQPFSDATVTADHATRTGVSLETKCPGFTGRGYVADWHRNHESVEVVFSVPHAGEYTVAVRYGAGAGFALRSLVVNGTTHLLPVFFPATPSWNDWRSTSFVVTLPAGPNRVELSYDSVLLSTNFLNLDAVTIASQPGQ